jgi:hypothetical protein
VEVNIVQEVAALERLSVGQLRQRCSRERARPAGGSESECRRCRSRLLRGRRLAPACRITFRLQAHFQVADQDKLRGRETRSRLLQAFQSLRLCGVSGLERPGFPGPTTGHTT